MPETEGKVVRWASIYDRWANMITLGKAPAIRRQTAELAQIKPGDVVLDVGCGTGELTLQARARAGTGGQVYGIDPVPAMIEVSRQKVAQTERNIHFQVGVIEELPFPDNHFDVVLSSLMMHHLPDELKQRGLVEIYRVLKPGGTLMIVDFKRPTSFISKSIITLLMHGGMQIGVQDLAPRLAAAGFNQIANGDMSFRPLGFIRAQAQKAGDSQ
jgi:demethylmenaquinone methyltransferase/2-methoxy-6-polyprenyl-1,4-benzoquinol methylase/phosphoethanolamine N-methyltransferase